MWSSRVRQNKARDRRVVIVVVVWKLERLSGPKLELQFGLQVGVEGFEVAVTMEGLSESGAAVEPCLIGSF